MNEQAKLLDINEMASLLGVQPSWLYQRTRRGQEGIPHLRVGKYIRFEADVVRRFLETQQNNDEAIRGKR